MKAVVFDFGGVMTTTTMPERVRKLSGELGIPWSAIQEGFARYRHAYDAGRITIYGMYAHIWEDAGLEMDDATTKRIVEADRASWLYRNERTLEWMKSLKAEGHTIGILTNMAPDFAPHFKEHFADFIAQADAMVISGLENMHKPNRDIYDLLRSRIRRDAADLVFIDDVQENCDGAVAAGWNAIRFTSNGQVEDDFARLFK